MAYHDEPDDYKYNMWENVWQPGKARARYAEHVDKQKRKRNFEDWKRKQDYLNPIDEYEFNRQIVKDARTDSSNVYGNTQQAMQDKERRQRMPGAERSPVSGNVSAQNQPRNPTELNSMVLNQIKEKGFANPAQRRHLIRFYGGKTEKRDAMSSSEMKKVWKLATDMATRGKKQGEQTSTYEVEGKIQNAKDFLFPNAKNEVVKDEKIEIPNEITDVDSAIRYLIEEKGMSSPEEALDWLRKEKTAGR